MYGELGLYIDGGWRKNGSGGKGEDVINPATEQTIGHVADAGPDGRPDEPEGVPAPAELPEQGPDEADDTALDQEDPEDLAARRAHRAQDPDLLLLLDH